MKYWELLRCVSRDKRSPNDIMLHCIKMEFQAQTMNGKDRLGILIPASKQSGLGHFYRTLPIYEWDPGILYLSYDPLIQQLGVRNLKLELGDEPPLLEQLKQAQITSLYIDHYSLGSEVLRLLSEQTDIYCTYFDGDFQNPAFPALINSNPYASVSSYETCDSEKKYFLGSSYFLLRKEIRKWKGTAKDDACFICFGGTDASGQTLEILPGLSKEKHYKIVLGMAAGEKYVDKVRSEIEGLGLNAALYSDPPDFFSLLASCRSAILSCSTIAQEALFLDVQVHCVVVAENQRRLSTFFKLNGIPVSEAGQLPKGRELRFGKLKMRFGENEKKLKKHLLRY